MLIVGGGPAGLSVASRLGHKHSCIVVHQDAEIGLPVRTSGGTWVRDMEALGIPKSMYQVIHKMDFYSDNQVASFHVQQDKMAVMDVTAVYQFLASEISNQNCQLMCSAKFLKCERKSSDHYVSHIRSRDLGDIFIHSKIIVDASGWQTAVLSSLNLREKPNRVGVGFEYEFPDENFDPNRAVLFVGETALHGYGWIFPTNTGTVRLGIGVINPDNDLSPRTMMDRFKEGNHVTRFGINIPEDCEVHSGIIPSEPFDPELVFGNVVRTGDCANFATPTVGEGIRIAIDFGRILGAELTAYLHGDAQALKRYEKTARREFQRDYRFGFMMNKRIALYSPERWDKSVKRLSRVSEREMTKLVRSNFGVKTILRTVLLNILAKFK